jgi:hypothetical protein
MIRQVEDMSELLETAAALEKAGIIKRLQTREGGDHSLVCRWPEANGCPFPAI